MALGGHALFRDEEDRLLVVRNHQHWHSDYVQGLSRGRLRIRDCVEPRVSEQMIAVLGEPVRDAFRDACWAFPTP